MIELWLLSIPLLIVAVFVFRRMRRSALWLRLTVAALVWLTIPLGITILVLIVGDRPTPGSKTYTPAEVARGVPANNRLQRPGEE